METSEGLADGQIQNDQVNSEHLIYTSLLFFCHYLSVLQDFTPTEHTAH